MTMDISNRKQELKSGGFEDQTEVTPIKVVKRPFDVAFLMLPDEKLKQKQKILKENFEKIPEEVYNNNESVDDEEDEEIEVGNNQDFSRVSLAPQKYFTQKQQIFDDPNILKTKNLEDLRCKSSPEQKSAFTKVNLNSKDMRLSPNLSISPDLSYQNSLSPSPPILNRNYQNTPNMLSPGRVFKTQQQQINAYQNNFLPENFTPENPFLIKNPNDLLQSNFQKIRPMYRPELSYNYQQFPTQEIRHPAAAILTSLLPPSLAALSLPAQNVCAKCNISFRMTSDLVYHMRSHHKNDAMDYNKRRREDKLKCPVCSESFRERHHLTRHMTAHQDKDDEGGSVNKKPT